MAAPPRLQRMLMRLQPYDLTIKYRQGKNMGHRRPITAVTTRERANSEHGRSNTRSVHAIQ